VKRRDDLAKMRSLLFKHEEKSRHLAKIKSKDYHRRLKKSARNKVSAPEHAWFCFSKTKSRP
jgi:U3 small nucleolar RNA-associated protein 14